MPTPNHNSPTSGKPPRPSPTPPSAGPPNPPIWLLIANTPVTVVRDLPAHAITTTGVTAVDRRKRATPQARATTAQGETRATKTRAARRPPPRQVRANHA